MEIPQTEAAGLEASSRSEYVSVRGLRYRLRHWGPSGAPRLLLLHGWADLSATFQFIADRLAHRWHLVAPDWRGCGDSEWAGTTYLLGDLACDLDGLITHVFGDDPARVVGHSMGANVAAMLAGARPGRIASLAMLDAYGTRAMSGADLFDKFEESLRRRTEDEDWVYPDMPSVVQRLSRVNPRLTPRQAHFLARELCEELPDGRARMRIDPAWRDTLYQLLLPPALYKELWRRIEIPVLLIGAEESYVLDAVCSPDPVDFTLRLAQLRKLQHVVLKDAGHNVHHDQPSEVARLLDGFCAASLSP